jgi:hypothetical protein
MTIYVGFTSPNQMLFDKYARHGEGELAVADRVGLTISGRAYSGYSGGGMVRVAPPYPEPVVLRLTNIQSGESVTVSEWSGDLGNWIITRGAFPDGNYEVTSNIPGTLGFTLQIRNSTAIIPPSKYLMQRPAYMPHMGGFPTNVKTNIVEFQGVRTGDSSPPVPFADAGRFSAPLTLANCWSESFGTNVPDYDGIAWPSTTPIGGLHYTAKQRYTVHDYASVVPDIEGYRAGPKNEAIYDHSPSERLDGGPGTGGAGVVPSGFKTSDGAIYILATTGSIIRVDPKTRAMTTVYGWVKKPGTVQPVAPGLLPAGTERENWLKQFFDFVGTGPTISRAWQMCQDAVNEMVVYVADCTNHTVVRVNLETGIGETIAGTLGVKGWRDGELGMALFDQPRGICMIKTGTYAGKLVVADEHNSAFRLVDPATGLTATLSRARKVPTLFPGSFSSTDLTRKVNRLAYGAPTNLDGTYNQTFKVQPFADAQFCHPCHLTTLSDGKTVVSVHHDEYRGFNLDLDAQTFTHLFDFEAAASRADVSPKDWPTIHADTNGSLGYGIDSLWLSSWHYNNMEVRSPITGAVLFGNFIGGGTCGDHQGIRHNAYSRAMIVLGDGSLIFSGDGQNSLCRVRKALPGDPVIDKARYDRGNLLYRSDGATRASVKTQNGTVGVNYLVQLKTPGELAMLSAAARKTYMVDTFGVADWSDQDHADVAYYLDCNCPLGVQRIRTPGWGDVAPVPAAPPVIIPPTVADGAPIDSTAKQQLGFAAALASIASGDSVGRLGASVVLSPDDVNAVDWVVI